MIKNLFATWRNLKFKLKIIFIVLASAIVGTSGFFLIYSFVYVPRHWCGDDVQRVDDQCIGVTDGRVALSADLADVLDKIRKENEHVAGADPNAVSVAYLIPLPKPSSKDELADLIHHELEGAYLAQIQANQTKALGDAPQVRLLVANSGDNSSQRERVVKDLLDKVNGSDRLVTVVATGRTKTETKNAIDLVRLGGVPVVASRLAGDSLTNLTPRDLEQVKAGIATLAPTGSAQGAAAATYLKTAASRVLIVHDTNTDDGYLKSFYEGFRSAFNDSAHTVLEPPETYDSQLGGVANTMTGILRSICEKRPEAVFFAGRSDGLAAFVQALPGRSCLDLPINIMSGGDSVHFATDVVRGDPELRKGLKANASVKYTTQAHPKAWEKSPEFFPSARTDQFTATCSRCFTQLFPGETLDDGGAIVGYDAIVAIVTAIRPGQGDAINDKPNLVSQQLKRMHGGGAVAGASGWISLSDDGTPVNRAVIILEAKSNGALEYITLSSPLPSRRPCVPDKPVTSPC
jgi:ABC-type branched-subunit amino acid transport system substrate-binding protein